MNSPPYAFAAVLQKNAADIRLKGGPTDEQVTEAMMRFGGGFVAGIGSLWRRGDARNRERLKAAFPDFWESYADMTKNLGDQHDG